MKNSDLRKGKNKLWAKWERHYGTIFAKAFRDAVEEKVGADIDEDISLDDLDASIRDFVEVAVLLQESKNGRSTKVVPKKKYRKCFERRFYLVDFVNNKGSKGKTGRIDWKQTTEEWNKAHPSDTMTSPNLKVQYNRAIKDDLLLLQYSFTEVWKLAKIWLHRQEEHGDPARESLDKDYVILAQQILHSLWVSAKANPPSISFLRSIQNLFEKMKTDYELRLRLTRKEAAKSKKTLNEGGIK